MEEVVCRKSALVAKDQAAATLVLAETIAELSPVDYDRNRLEVRFSPFEQ